MAIEAPLSSATAVVRQPKPAVLWDFHGTILGLNTPQLGDTRRWQARPGIVDVLTRLHADGVRHVITTGGETPFVLQQMDDADPTQSLRRCIGERDIFPKSIVDAGVGKRYRDVARELGFPDERSASAGMVAVGDVITDQPVDIDGMVFIFEPNGVGHNARTVTRVIEELQRRGAGDFSRGFLSLHATPGEDASIGRLVLQIDADGEQFGVFTQERRPFQDRERFGFRAHDVTVSTVRIQPLNTLTELASYQPPIQRDTRRDSVNLWGAVRSLFNK